MPYHELHKGRRSLTHQVYHVTTATQNRQPLFADFALGRLVVRQLMQLEQESRVETLCFVIMPDHMHWLMSLPQGSLPEAVRLLKGRAARKAGRPLWQAGFHDHALRREEELVEVARYIVANPLRAGLVKRISDYPLWDAIWL
jgi:REP element-mobilizing transposase RayT